jgi:hypothetical protein
MRQQEGAALASGGLWPYATDASCLRTGRLRCGLLQLHQQDVSGGVANVFAVVALRRQPSDRTRLQFHLSLNVTRHETPARRTQRVHKALRVLMRSRVVTRLIRVLKYSNPLVLETDLVVLRVAGNGIEPHAGSMPEAQRLRDLRDKRAQFGIIHGADRPVGGIVQLL